MIFSANWVCRELVAVAVNAPAERDRAPTSAGVGAAAVGAGSREQLRRRLQRIRIVRPVEDVEQLRAELDVERLAQLGTDCSSPATCRSPAARPDDRVPPRVAQDRVVARRLRRIAVAGSVDVVDLVLLVDRVAARHRFGKSNVSELRSPSGSPLISGVIGIPVLAWKMPPYCQPSITQPAAPQRLRTRPAAAPGS